MPDAYSVLIEDEWAQMVNRLAAATSKMPEEVIQFALAHFDKLMQMEPGQSVTIRKKRGESFLSVGDVLGESVRRNRFGRPSE